MILLFCIEKPGKSKFAPVLGGGERRKPVVAAAASRGTEIRKEDVTTPDTLHPKKTASIAEELLTETPVSPVGVKRQTTIEAVAARRERKRSLVHDSMDLPLITNTNNITSAASLVNYTPSARDRRVTMASFLKDTGIGLPMTISNITAGSTANKKSTQQPKASTTSNNSNSRSVATSVAPQVRILNGEIVVDEETVALTANTSTGPDYSMDIVNEGTGRHLTSHAFVKTTGNNRWSRSDTDLFYDALSMCGTDFALISLLFPKRSREQIKGKYKVEERSNLTRVNLALKNKKPLDTAWLERVKKLVNENDSLVAGGEERRRGRPKVDPNMDSYMDSLLSSPVKTPKSSPTKTIPVPAKIDIFAATLNKINTPSPRRSPRIVNKK